MRGWTLLALVVGIRSADAQTLLWLEEPPNALSSELYAVSADGTIAVGVVQIGARTYAARWTESSGVALLGTLGGQSSYALAVSADGQIVAGWSYDLSGHRRAFRWTPVTGMQSMGTLYGHRASEAYAISADGTLIAGLLTHGNTWEPFCWYTNGSVWLLNTSPYWDFTPRALSADGQVVAGFGRDATGRVRALCKTPEGMWNLGTLGGSESCAHAISPDGQIVVGSATLPNGRARAFRWRNGVMENLGVPDGFIESIAYGVSADGNAVVGEAVRMEGNQYASYAALWTLEEGMGDLNQRFASLLSDGSVLLMARAISADGSTIVGTGRRPTGKVEGFILRLASECQLEGDANRDRVVDDADLLEVLFNFGQTGFASADLNRDGVVDDADLLIVLFNFGNRC
ncbi:MAG: HAF repeat-containing protein [Armatimonadetes bacterium]|nr:HAF repeat-containing protein [Armatimonadota bacterium]CUU34441.1 probable extracellular repeat, HAF family [Armatimonadetes bacterium DC]